jgi:lipid-binding SYLF domain-containing protein
MQRFCCWLLVAVLCPLVLAQTKSQSSSAGKGSNTKSSSKSKSQPTPNPTPTPTPSPSSSLVPEEQRRLQEAGTVLKEMLNMPDYIPQALVNKAECVLVFPEVKKFAIGIGGSSGHGALSCRTGEKFRGPWSPPAIYSLKAGSIGLQVGGQTTDFILLIMNPRGVDSVLRSKIKLGSDAAIAAGPRGRLSSASSDASMHAEILAYPRSRKGFFAGVSLEGATLGQDNNANQKVYGRKVTAIDIVRLQSVQVTQSGTLLVSTLNKLSPSNLADTAQ